MSTVQGDGVHAIQRMMSRVRCGVGCWEWGEGHPPPSAGNTTLARAGVYVVVWCMPLKQARMYLREAERAIVRQATNGSLLLPWKFAGDPRASAAP